MTEKRVYIGLGSNLGDRLTYLREAVRQIAAIMRVERVSSLYIAAPTVKLRDDAYLNAVLCGYTTTKPLGLLKQLQAIECGMGRRPGVSYGPRPIDLDILLYGSVHIDQLEIKIPHPELSRRAFVLKPLAELDPQLMHPVLYYSVSQLLQDADEADTIVMYNPPTLDP